MILKKYLEINEIYKEISNSLSLYDQNSVDLVQNKERIKNFILLITPIFILFLSNFFILNDLYQNYANDFVANISPDLLINDLGKKIDPVIYTLQENFLFLLLYVTTSTIACMPIFILIFMEQIEDYDFNNKENFKKSLNELLKLLFWSLVCFIFLALLVDSVMFLVFAFIIFADFMFSGIGILLFISYLYDHVSLKKQKNKYNNKKEYVELKDKRDLIKKELDKLEKDLFKDETSMLLIIDYIHNNEKYIEEIENKYNFGLSKDEMNALLSKSVNKTQQELIKESFMNDFQKKHKPILND